MKATQVEELVLSDEEVEFGNPAATPSKRSLSGMFISIRMQRFLETWYFLYISV